jgi:hypothetical protein
MTSGRRGAITAEELMKQLNADPEYRARVAKADAERRAFQEALTRAERPVVADLRAAGLRVRSAWDLYQLPESGEIAYPILVKHLRLDYPGRVLNGIGRAIRKEVARSHWSELLALYLQELTDCEARDGLAATLSGCAVRAHYDDLLAILENEGLGESRIYFLRPVNRIGNRIAAGQGRAAIERFRDHPVLGVEADAILRGRGRND